MMTEYSLTDIPISSHLFFQKNNYIQTPDQVINRLQALQQLQKSIFS